VSHRYEHVVMDDPRYCPNLSDYNDLIFSEAKSGTVERYVYFAPRLSGGLRALGSRSRCASRAESSGFRKWVDVRLARPSSFYVTEIIRAAVESLKHLGGPSHVTLHSDSAYLINGMNRKWYLNWERNGWKTKKNKPVQNPDLWKELIELSKLHSVEWVKVMGHAGNGANERCDRLVRLAWSKVGVG
jgi:hypothetical protein